MQRKRGLRMATTINVLRGNQIGGGIVFISTEKTKIMIDYGENLPGYVEQEEEKDVNWNAEMVDAVFFTHYHGDHIGRFMEIPADIPLYMGTVTRKILLNIQETLGNTEVVKALSDYKRIHELSANKTICIDDIKITPYLVDHSAYDAYMFLIETPDKIILHTGDFRNHGYRGKALIPMIRKYITNYGQKSVDILIMEGTMMSRQDEKIYSEAQMKEDAIKLFKKNRYVFLICSSTNLDSLATFYQAAQVCHRGMYANKYVYSQLKTFSETAGLYTSLYKFQYTYLVNFDSILPGLNITQEAFMRKNGFLIIIKAEEKYNKWVKRFMDLNPVVIYSMWEGYLNPMKNAYNKEMHDFVKNNHAIYMYTGGHAPASVIAQVINEINPRENIIPIHTEHPEAFYNLDIRQELKDKLKLRELSRQEQSIIFF